MSMAYKPEIYIYERSAPIQRRAFQSVHLREVLEQRGRYIASRYLEIISYYWVRVLSMAHNEPGFLG
jgi:hypothetical protein